MSSTNDDNGSNTSDGAEAAANIARSKIDALHKAEPDAKEELIEASDAGVHRSKHQEFMQKLSTSGKSLAEIQTAWHQYYVGLPDTEKHEVWQEFYSQHENKRSAAENKQEQGSPPDHSPTSKHKQQTVADVKKRIIKSVGAPGKVSKKQHLHSLIFGVGMGAVVMLIFMFSFFNERFIAPFITPSRTVSSTPIIIDPSSSVAGPGSKVIIPKINVEVPVVYDLKTTKEEAIQKALENGVVHYSTTPSPGQKGNIAIVGHSSNNIFNPGKYKFAFVLLSKLEKGDMFYLTKDKVKYAYRINEKKIVKPTDVSILGPNDKPATATLITCDPPGTSLNRLVIVGEQISPDPVKNKASTAAKADTETSIVAGNAPSLWQRIKDLIF